MVRIPEGPPFAASAKDCHPGIVLVSRVGHLSVAWGFNDLRAYFFRAVGTLRIASNLKSRNWHLRCPLE